MQVSAASAGIGPGFADYLSRPWLQRKRQNGGNAAGMRSSKQQALNDRSGRAARVGRRAGFRVEPTLRDRKVETAIDRNWPETADQAF